MSLKSSTRLRTHRYTLELKHQFTIANNSRATTPVVILELESEGFTGYGEASLPPYLPEKQESVEHFLSLVPTSLELENIEQCLGIVDRLATENHAAKAAFDIALHDWYGKKIGKAWHQIWGLDLGRIPTTSFTIGIDTREGVQRKVPEAADYRTIKVKLGGPNDREILSAIREVTDKPLRVDANQGWTERNEALKNIEWCAGQGVELVEQPMPRDRLDDHQWLTQRSPIPIIADEAVQRLTDIAIVAECYHGINIKLMKCTGMHEAYAMIAGARKHGLKVMLGCMTETSCAISAAAQLSPLADWIDLDGAALVRNDPFDGARIVNGRVTPSSKSGIGVRMKEKPFQPR